MNFAKKSIKIIAVFILIFTLAGILGATGLYIYSFFNIDTKADEALFALAKEGNVTEFYANGAPIGSDNYIPVKLESASHVENKKVWYSFDEIGELLKKGFVAVEDKEFYDHDGVNFRRTLAALANSLFKFEKRFGASTITQQVVKNISGDNDLSFRRKLNEILRAMTIEKKHSKKEILELYLNIVPMGENTVGVGLASKIYFDKMPSELDPAEAALLIGLANAPTKYNPYINPESAKEKRDSVLQTMYEHGIISTEECEMYKNTDITLNPREKHRNIVNSWFIETVCADIIADLSEKYRITQEAAKKMVTGGGLTVYTTQSIEIQSVLEEYFENEKNLPKEIENGLDYSAVVIDSLNGNLLGIIGQSGKKNGEWLLNHATEPHMPASVIKPLSIYAPLLDRKAINWASVFDDVPLSFTESNGEYIEYPHNSPNRYDGLINVKKAVTESKNTVSMRLYKMLGSEKIFKLLKNDFGMNSLVDSYYDENGNFFTDKAPAPLALGQLTNGVSLRALTAAYTVFPSYGVLNKNRSYLKVLDNDNNILLENKPKNRRIFARSTAEIINQLLSLVVSDGTAKSVNLKELVDTAGKTGTSAFSKDKLFVGYTPYITMGLWCGYENGATSVEGVSPSHLEIWDSIAISSHKSILSNLAEENIKHFKKDELMYLPYCRDSGRVYSEQCMYDPRGERIEYGYFSADNVPRGECDTHILLRYNLISGEIVSGDYSEFTVPISLIKAPERSFPKEITITDEKFVYSHSISNKIFIPFSGDALPKSNCYENGNTKKRYESDSCTEYWRNKR